MHTFVIRAATFYFYSLFKYKQVDSGRCAYVYQIRRAFEQSRAIAIIDYTISILNERDREIDENSCVIFIKE